MQTIETMEQFNEATGNYEGTTCLFFVINKSQPCRAIEPMLIAECDRNDIQILKIPVDNTEFFNLITKYGVGILPRYLFIRHGEVLYSTYGRTSQEVIREEIKKIGESK